MATAQRRLAEGRFRSCNDAREGPSEKRPHVDTTYCARHREMADKSNRKVTENRRKR